MKKYSPIEIIFLRAPKLNPVYRTVLRSNSIIKRNTFNCKDQDHDMILCALGEAISKFLVSEIQQLLSPDTSGAKSQ